MSFNIEKVHGVKTHIRVEGKVKGYTIIKVEYSKCLTSSLELIK